MESFSFAQKPHAVCIPFPLQSHINVMVKFAKVLHSKGFHITFVNTEFIHQKVLMSRGPDSFQGLPDDFRFETIPDGLAPSEVNATQHPIALIESIATYGRGYVRSLIGRLNEESSKSSAYPKVSCIVADFIMTCTLEAVEELGIPKVLLWPMSASFLDFFHHRQLLDKALLKLKDKSYAANAEYLDMPIDFIPGLSHMRLKDVPVFFWDRIDPQKHTDIVWREYEKYTKASAIVVNTFDDLEREVLDAMKSIPPAIYPIGPLQLLEKEIPNKLLRTFGNNLLKEHTDCLEWLDSQKPNSVLYISFGTTAVMTNDHLIEFAWGLANCKHPFLWVINPDLVIGKVAILPPGFMKETADRAMISGWCPQEEVLHHSSTGGFLTHSGWSSIMDTMSAGVPIISWPSSFIDQVPNCRNACVRWCTGLEIDINVKRDEVEKMVRELMENEKGKELKKKAMEWKKSAQESIKPGGSSYVNLDKVIQEVLLLH